jgi:hypothetical protein
MITLFLVVVSAVGVSSQWMYFANMDLCEAAKTTIVKEMETPRNAETHVAFSACLVNQLGKTE